MPVVMLLAGILSVLLLLAGRGAQAENVTLCWGSGNFGQLGDGQSLKTTPRNLPHYSTVPIQISDSHSFATVCGGGGHSCALEPSGNAWCWGFGSYGALGAGSNSDSNTPVEVTGGRAFQTITCGDGHTCALDGEGQAWCWGKNSVGQLGTGNDADSSVPVAAAAGRKFKALSAGGYHTCGLEAGGKAVCWGSNSHGQLGAGMSPAEEFALQEPSSYVPVEVAGGYSFKQISSGAAFTCALSQEGTAYCFGDGSDQQLGPQSNRTVSSPVPAFGESTAYEGTLTTLAAGSTHVCGLEPDGTLYCWGGTPANGREQATSIPEEVGGGRKFVAVSAGTALTCALDAAGDIWCLGLNMFGELGNGGQRYSYKLEKVAGGHQFIHMGQTLGSHICTIATKEADAGVADPSPLPSSAASPSEAQPAGTNSTNPPSTGASSSSSSTVPIGAVVGGIAGAAVVLAVLAFFALRPGKGWLRRKSVAAAAAEDGGLGNGKAHPAAGGPAAGGGQQAGGNATGAPSKAAAVGPLQAAWVSSQLGPDTLLPFSRVSTSSQGGPDTLLPFSCVAGSPLNNPVVGPGPTEPTAPAPSNISGAGWLGGGAQPGPYPLPASYLSSAGLAGGPAFAWRPAAAQQTSSHSSSAYTATVSSHSGSEAVGAAQQQPAAAAFGGSAGRGSGGLELRSDTRVWEVQWEELTILRCIGRGSFGSVHLAEWNQVHVAVKVLGKGDFNPGQLELPERVLRDLQAEAAVMSHMRHPNVVQFMGLVATPPALITEYCSRGSLYDCLAAAREHPAAAAQLTWRRRLAMAVDAGAGLLYLHKRSIIHRDVKSPNLLVDEHLRVKVADFNLSKLLEGARPEASLTSAAATNPIWLAPEVVEGGKAMAASDVYSFGMVLFELLTWRLPWSFASMTPFKVGATIRQGGRPEVPPREALPGPDTAGWAGLDAYVQLMRHCWAQRPEDRPSFAEVVGRLRRLLEDAAGS